MQQINTFCTQGWPQHLSRLLTRLAMGRTRRAWTCAPPYSTGEEIKVVLVMFIKYWRTPQDRSLSSRGDDADTHEKPTKKKRKRCGECSGCQRKDNCGDCAPCRNEKSHQICKNRRCDRLTEKKVGALPFPMFCEFIRYTCIVVYLSINFSEKDVRKGLEGRIGYSLFPFLTFADAGSTISFRVS